MAKKPSPWFWEARDGWYITRNGQHVNLGKHPADSPPPSKHNGKRVVPDPIMQAFYAAMASNTEAETIAIIPRQRSHRRGNLREDTLPGARSIARPAPTTGIVTTSRASSTLSPKWATCRLPNCGPTTSSSGPIPTARIGPLPTAGAGSLPSNGHSTGPSNWGTSPPTRSRKYPSLSRSGGITRSRPTTSPSCSTITRRATPSATCCCSHGIPVVVHRKPRTSRHGTSTSAAECIVIPKGEAKGKRRPRVIHLAGPALEIVGRLLAAAGDGKLFRNEDGVPWKKSAIAKRFERFQLAYGIKKLKELGIPIPPLPRFNRRKYSPTRPHWRRPARSSSGN